MRGDGPAPEVLAAEIVEDLQAALDEFAAIAETLQRARGEGESAGVGAVDPVPDSVPGGDTAAGDAPVEKVARE